MTLRFEWLGLAEAAIEDGRGVNTLVGLNQNVIVTEQLPIVAKRAVVVILVAEGDPALEPGSDLTLEISVEAPDDRRLMSATQTIQIGEPKWPGIPGGVNVAAQLQMSLSKYGTYRIRCTAIAESTDDTIEATKELFVVEP